MALIPVTYHLETVNNALFRDFIRIAFVTRFIQMDPTGIDMACRKFQPLGTTHFGVSKRKP